MSDHVPDEVLREILSRLTVTPLLRFRSVCKPWKCLIDSDHFIRDHLNHSRKSNSNLNIIIRSTGCLYSTDFDDLFTAETETNLDTFQELFHPLKTQNLDTEILGSCDGLLVLSNGEEENILWNPSTRRLHNIPVTDMAEYLNAMQYIVYGFGYDALSDDYKLIRIVHNFAMGNNECDSEVKVYSLKSNSWRRISNFPYFLGIRRGNGELANGALHWVVSDTHSFNCLDNLVAAFDVGTEDYRLVPLPEFETVQIYMCLRVLGDCLSLVCDYDKGHIDIWVMKEYGVQESWSRFFTLVGRDLCYASVDFMMPIAYSNCGRKVLIRFESSVMWYDLDKKCIDLPIVQIPYEGSFMLDTCLKSLVPLNNNSDFVSKNEGEEKKGLRRITNRRNGFLSFWFDKLSRH